MTDNGLKIYVTEAIEMFYHAKQEANDRKICKIKGGLKIWNRFQSFQLYILTIGASLSPQF